MYNTANYEPKRPIYICHSFLLAVGLYRRSLLRVASSSQGSSSSALRVESDSQSSVVSRIE